MMRRSDSRPGGLPIALLRLLLPRAERDEVLADIAEEYAARAARDGDPAVRRWLWRQALGSVPALLRWSWWRTRTGFEAPANAYRPGASMVRNWITDARYAARRLRARPGYAVVAVVTLALGVGGTAAVYGIARGLFLDPLPYAHEREVGVFWQKTNWTEGEFLYLRGRTPGFRQLALYRFDDVTLRQGEAPARVVRGVAASSELFEVLGARPVLGRGFRGGDDADGAERVAVLSYGLWREVGGDPSIVGASLTLDGRRRTVVGVMPRGFWFPDPSVRIWVSEPLNADAPSWNSTLIGRVGSGRDAREMAAPVARITAMLGERFDYPARWDKTRDARITPVREDIVGDMRPALLATLGAMALILLIACANVAALMLGQVSARSAELAVRSALGADRRRLTQQLVIETLIIAAAAGGVGAAVAWGAFPVLARALPLGALAEAAAPDWTVFLSGTGIALAAALLIVLVPTASLWRGDVRGALTSARTGTLQGRGGRLESGLVVAQVAFAVLIASGAALLARSVSNLYAVDPGVQVQAVGVVDVTVGGDPGRTRRRGTIEGLRAGIAELPGVRSAAAAQMLPLRGGGYNLPLEIEGRPDIEGVTTEYRMVTPGYLETMGIALRAGRAIGRADRRDAEPVVVINEALAERYFGGADPIGRRVGNGMRFARVIGVVANAAERELTDDAVPVRYVPVAQMPWVDEAQSLVFRVTPGGDPGALLDAARATVGRLAPGVPVRAATTMSRVLDTAVGPPRAVMLLLALVTGLALTLGAIGVYGVSAHFAARRRREWAIRIALGLSAARAVRQLVGRAAVFVAAGIGLGVVAAAALGRLLTSFLYGVTAADPIAFGAAAVALLTVGLAAAFIPARRVGRIDPVIVLREQ